MMDVFIVILFVLTRRITEISCDNYSGLHATDVTRTKIFLAWSSMHSNNRRYVVRYKPVHETAYQEVDVSGTVFNLIGLEPGTSYEIRLQESGSIGVEDDVILIATKMTEFNSVAPHPTTNFGLSIKEIGETFLSLVWRESGDENEYLVRYKPLYEERYQETKVTGTSLTLVGLEPGTTYEVRLQRNNILNKNEDEIEVATKVPNFSKDVATKVPNVNKDVATKVANVNKDVAMGEMRKRKASTTITQPTAEKIENRKPKVVAVRSVTISSGNVYTTVTVAPVIPPRSTSVVTDKDESNVNPTVTKIYTQHRKKLKLVVKSTGQRFVSLAWSKYEGYSTYTVRYKAFYEETYHSKNTTKNFLNLNGLEPGTTYELLLTGDGNTQTIGDVTRVSTKVKLYRRKPLITEIANVTRFSAKVAWYSVMYASVYNVAYRSQNSSRYIIKYVIRPPISLRNLIPWTTYIVKVQVGHSPYGYGPWSDKIEFRTKPNPPSSPIDVHVCSENANPSKSVSVLLCWSAPQEVNSQYNDNMFYSVNWCARTAQTLVRTAQTRSVFGCNTKRKILHSFTSPSNQTYLIRNIAFFSSLWVRVTSFASDGTKGGTITKDFVLNSLPAPPIITASAIGWNTVNLSWISVPYATGYRLSYNIKNSDSFPELNVKEPNLQLSGLNRSTTYIARVRTSFKVVGVGRVVARVGHWSEKLKFKTKPGPPSPPRELRVYDELSDGKDGVVLLLSWNQPVELERSNEHNITYAIKWCVHAVERLTIYGCYVKYKIPHSYTQPSKQTYFIEYIPFGTSVWITVSTCGRDGTKGKSAHIKYKVTSRSSSNLQTHVVESVHFATQFPATETSFDEELHSAQSRSLSHRTYNFESSVLFTVLSLIFLNIMIYII